MGALTLVFDGYCGFCTRSVQWIARLDRNRRVRFEPFQRPGVLQAYGLTAEECEEAAWAITPGGRRMRGAEAINAALAAALGIRAPLAAYRLPGVRQVQDALYAWVARNRRRFRAVTPWCVAHPEAGCDEAPASCTLPQR
jgi:predicted DCC family thiol-disulfide oxidoreductase YuxK